MIFIKKAGIVLTNDHWKVVINFKLTPYEKAIEFLRADMEAVEKVTHRTSLIDEVLPLQTAVNSLQSKLINLKRFLPRPERRRGLLTVGGSFLKLIFGTVTVADLADLHTTVDSLNQKQGEVVHSLNQQLTYFKQMESTVKLHHGAIANLSNILKDFAIKSQEKFQKTVSRLQWAVKLQEATAAVRELECSFVQLQMQVDELLGAFQTLTAGRIPVSLIAFNTLHDILENVTLNLPEGYELTMGTQYALVCKECTGNVVGCPP